MENKTEEQNKETGKIIIPNQPQKLITLDEIPEGFIKDFVNFAHPLSEAALQFQIAAALVTVSSVIGRNIYLEEGGYRFYPNLYVLVVGGSGYSRKSVPINLLYKFLSHVTPNTILGDWMSLEAFFDAFRTVNCRTICCHELKSFLTNADRSYGEGLLSFITSLWDNPPEWRLDLKGCDENKRNIQSPTLNILAATTPDWMSLKEGDVIGGFLGRFTTMYSEKDNREIPIMPPMDQHKFKDLVGKLEIIKGIQHEYVWAEDAVEVMKEKYHQLHVDFKKEQNKTFMHSHWFRSDTHWRKLAMIFDICSLNPTFKITKENFLAAYKFMSFATDCYREVIARLPISPAAKKEQQFLDMLGDTADGVEHSVLMRNLHLGAKFMGQIVSTLIEKEQIEIKLIDTGRKKKRVYCLKEAE